MQGGGQAIQGGRGIMIVAKDSKLQSERLSTHGLYLYSRGDISDRNILHSLA